MDFNYEKFYHSELYRVGAILPGHYRLKAESGASKRHGEGYIDKYEVLKNARLTMELADLIAARFKQEHVEVVVGPETGGMLFARHVGAALLGRSSNGLRILFAEERKRGMFRLRDVDAHEVYGKRVLVVEDVITTGYTVIATIEAVNACGGEVVGVGAMCNRESISYEKLPIPDHSLYAAVNMQMRSWPAHRCALCGEKFPIDTPARKRAEMRDRVITTSLGSSVR
ncbi:MAG: phosphoribosyltransferase family protein [Patescibacteria group bacterium]